MKAFPIPGPGEQIGMDLRDWFAGHFLNGIISNSLVKHDPSDKKLAEISYSMADAMMEAREKNE